MQLWTHGITQAAVEAANAVVQAMPMARADAGTRPRWEAAAL